MTDIILQVAAKVVLANADSKVLILRESKTHDTNTKAGHYQLPGGRIEPGENFFDGLKREILEETELTAEIGKPLLVGEWRPVIKGRPHQIIGLFLSGKVLTGKARLSDEHDELLWIDPQKWADYDIMTPDCDALAAYAASL